MGTENSSAETRERAKELSNEIGGYHIDLNMDSLVASVQSLFSLVTNKTPRFKVHGGSQAENLALQNIQVTENEESRTDLGTIEDGHCIFVRATSSLGSRPLWRFTCSRFVECR